MNQPIPNNNQDATEEHRGNALFPVFFKLEQLSLLIVGGGSVALEKLVAVMSNAPDASIILVAPLISDEIKILASKKKKITIIERDYQKIDLRFVDIVIAAVDTKDLSTQIVKDCKEQGVLVNVADQPELCDFYLGSIVKKGDLKIAISTNGKSPTMAKRIKELLQESIPDEMDQILQNMSEIRKGLQGDFSEKVKKLNEITTDLLSNHQQKQQGQRWRKFAYWISFAFIFLFLGNIIASYYTVVDLGHGIEELLVNIEPQFYWMILAGFLAQMVDGALGMGYGVTCTSVLMSIGIPLPAISSSIHTAEMFSSGASGFSHYKFGNVNKKLFRLILIPAILGAISGAWLLATFGEKYAHWMRPMLAVYTLFLGVKILLNAFKKKRTKGRVKRVGVLAWAGGFLDSFGGGGWGPLVTSTLISKGKSPRYVIGTVSLTEFFVTLCSAVTFFTILGIKHWQVIAGLIVGGVLAAPIAAKLAGRLPIKFMFVGVGSLIIVWSLNIFIKTLF